MAFFTTILYAYGIQRPPKPSSTAMASTMLCDPSKLCGDTKNTSCAEFQQCSADVTHLATADGSGRPVTKDGNVQKTLFIAQHFDLLNVTKLDHTISTVQTLLKLSKSVPLWAWGFIGSIGFMVGLVSIVPAFVIFIELMSNKFALAKFLVLVTLTVLIIVGYVLVPL